LPEYAYSLLGVFIKEPKLVHSQFLNSRYGHGVQNAEYSILKIIYLTEKNKKKDEWMHI
jgi:hypothetical protein